MRHTWWTVCGTAHRICWKIGTAWSSSCWRTLCRGKRVHPPTFISDLSRWNLHVSVYSLVLSDCGFCCSVGRPAWGRTDRAHGLYHQTGSRSSSACGQRNRKEGKLSWNQSLLSHIIDSGFKYFLLFFCTSLRCSLPKRRRPRLMIRTDWLNTWLLLCPCCFRR